jgi:hypothetical protein
MIDKEEQGDRPYFEKLLDDTFHFRRADAKGTVVDKDVFLNGLSAAARRGRTLEPPGVDVSYYEDLAVASLRIRIRNDLYRNIRIFRSGSEGWRLGMWYNNKIT